MGIDNHIEPPICDLVIYLDVAVATSATSMMASRG